MSIDKEIRRGEQARLLLQNELYQEAVESVKQAIIDKWISAPIRDKEGAHELKLMLKLLGEVTGYIETALDTGKLATIQLDNERRLDKLKQAGI